MPVQLWYRADTRSLAEIGTAGGFKSWQSTTLDEGRALAKLFIAGGKDALPKAVKAYLISPTLVNGVKLLPKLNTLGDMSTYIKYTKDKSTTWVSAAENRDCGGQSGGAPIYRITVTVDEYGISGGQYVAQVRTSNLKPGLIMNNANVDLATIIALVHGPRGDAEASFLTPIPSTYIDKA